MLKDGVSLGEGGEVDVSRGEKPRLLVEKVFYSGKMISACVVYVNAAVVLGNLVVDVTWRKIFLSLFLSLVLAHDLYLAHVLLPLDVWRELIDCSSSQ